MNTRITKLDQLNVLGHECTICGTLEEPLFKASEVAKWLGHTNSRQMLKSVPRDEIKQFPSQFGNINYLTEFGVYFVLMRSRTNQASVYQKRIMEILKQLRLNGYAVSDSITEEQMANARRALGISGEKFASIEDELVKLLRYVRSNKEAILNSINEIPNETRIFENKDN